MLMIFKTYGIDGEEDQDRVTYFLKEIYNKCQEVELTPQQVFDYISDILKFSSEISLSQIPHYIKKRIEEKEGLERDVQKLSENIDELANIEGEKKQEIQSISKYEETKTKNYRMFILAKSSLAQYGIVMDDINKFIQSFVALSKEKYDPIQILTKITNYDNLKKESADYKEQVNRKKDELHKLNQEINVQETNLSYFKIKIDIINELEIRGFGNTELRTLINMLNEIGREHNLDFNDIRKKYFDDVKNYEEVIGSRMEIDK